MPPRRADEYGSLLLLRLRLYFSGREMPPRRADEYTDILLSVCHVLCREMPPRRADEYATLAVFELLSCHLVERCLRVERTNTTQVLHLSLLQSSREMPPRRADEYLVQIANLWSNE